MILRLEVKAFIDENGERFTAVRVTDDGYYFLNNRSRDFPLHVIYWKVLLDYEVYK